MERETYWLKGRPVYVTFTDDEERRIFQRIQAQDGLAAAYRWWLGRHRSPPVPPAQAPRPLFDERLDEALLAEWDWFHAARSPYPEHPDWRRLTGVWDFYFELYPKFGLGDATRYEKAFRSQRLVGGWDGLWVRFMSGVQPIAGPQPGDVQLPEDWVYAMWDVSGVRERQLNAVPFQHY